MTELSSLLLEHYPCLAAIPPARLGDDLEKAAVLEVPERTTLFLGMEPCAGFPFVLEGQVKVARASADRRELELYRVHPGEICVVSTGCLLGGAPMSAHGAAVTRTRLAMVDRATLLGWAEFPSMRVFLLCLMADRMAELVGLVEAVAFQRLDRRLANALLGHWRVIRATHQQLADELGTAREMVSRLLKRFEEQGTLRLGREQIGILDAARLRALAGPD